MSIGGQTSHEVLPSHATARNLGRVRSWQKATT